jgi:trehalose/maltose hydrolase-like predicted phosphorylase
MVLIPELERATALSVGAEPSGVPERVLGIGGGPATFLRILADQIERRRRGDLPTIDEDPRWTVILEGYDPLVERARSALLTLADGRIGSTGGPLTGDGTVIPEVLAAGLYDGALPETRLLSCPSWNRLIEDPRGPTGLRRVLDMRSGVLGEWSGGPVSMRSIRFSSIARPGTAGLRVQVPAAGPEPDAGPATRAYEPGEAAARGRQGPLIPPIDEDSLHVEQGSRDGSVWIGVRGSGGGIVAAAAERRSGGAQLMERLAVYHPDPLGDLSPEPALDGLAEAEATGFDGLLREQREAWALRWRDADIVIEGDPELQRAVRFALFHLMASVADSEEAAVGARGLSGPAYQGHVFWDADVFVLPFLAATHPSAARAMLEYRLRRLSSAQGAAHALGRAGARFPWESASSGRDVTPSSARDRTGRVIPIRTGLLEEHIVADVAWAAHMFWRWTGDAAFMAGPGKELLVETARYWASRVRFDRGGRAHIYGVIGPDEYHEPVDDSAFTNVMARWNLRAAAAAVKGRSPVGRPERQRWLEIADALIDGYDPASGIYEEFAGFHRLESVIIRDVAPKRPIAADLLLGRDRVRKAQVVKQADVLMLHHMVPEEIVPGSLQPNLRYYEPRTAHGSSLSPGVHAALFARAGRLSEAVQALRLAARIDLDDLTETTSGGLHLATMGSVWQALVFGFAGVWAEEAALRIDPKLPFEWDAMEIRVRFRAARVCVRVEPSGIHIRTDGPISIRLGEGPEMIDVEQGGLDVELSTRPTTEPTTGGGTTRKEVT